jgi:hypothetical protein
MSLNITLPSALYALWIRTLSSSSLQSPCTAHNVSGFRNLGFIGTGKNYTCFHINVVCHALGKDKSIMALPLCLYYTCCDTTSAYCGNEKKSAWEAWNSYCEVTQTFKYMAVHPLPWMPNNFPTSGVLHRRPL